MYSGEHAQGGAGGPASACHRLADPGDI